MERIPIETETGTGAEDDVEATVDPGLWGELVEVATGDDVDGDFNGAPERVGLEKSQGWTGVDVLDAMHGRDAEALNLGDDEPDAERVALLHRLRDELAERLEAMRAELPDRIAASEHEIAPADDEIANTVQLIASLEQRIARLDAALARVLHSEDDAETLES